MNLQLQPIQWVLGGEDSMPPRGSPIVVAVFGDLAPATYSAFSVDHYERLEKYVASLSAYSPWTWAVLYHPNEVVELPANGGSS